MPYVTYNWSMVDVGANSSGTPEPLDPTQAQGALVGDLVRSTRLAAGLTQQELADRAETTQSMVARYESDAVSPTVRALSRLLAACGKTLILGAGTKVNTAETMARPGQSDYLNRPASGWSPGRTKARRARGSRESPPGSGPPGQPATVHQDSHPD